MKYSEIAKVYEVGPIAVSDDREQDYTYKVEVLRDVGEVEAYRLFLWSKDKYFVRRRLKNSDNNRKWDNPYQVEVRRDLEGIEEYHLFNWDTAENAARLESRLRFLDQEILSKYADDLTGQ